LRRALAAGAARALVGAALVGAALVGGAARAAPPPPPRVAVLALRNDADLHPREARSLTEVALGELAERLGERYAVVSAEDLAPGVSARPCVERGARCEAERRRSLDVEFVVSGALTRLGRSWRASLKVYRQRDARLLGARAGVSAAVEGLAAQARHAAAAAAALIDPASAPPEEVASRALAALRAEAPGDPALSAALARLDAERRVREAVEGAAAETAAAETAAAETAAAETAAAETDAAETDAAETDAAETDAAETAAAETEAGETAAAEAEAAAAETARSRAQESAAPPPGDPIEWVPIPAGRLHMGSDRGPPDEAPARWVDVRAFELSKTEVTVAQYARCVAAGACDPPAEGGARGACAWGRAGLERHPVNCVDWGQARTFARWAGGDLPTEAEWEYAARAGGAADPAPRAPRALDAVAWHRGTSGRQTRPAGALRPNPFGLHDTLGNVWEWTLDAYAPSYARAPRHAHRPAGGAPRCGARCPNGAARRVSRGGSWNSPPETLSLTFRDSALPRYQSSALGFRVRRAPTPAPPAPPPAPTTGPAAPPPAPPRP